MHNAELDRICTSLTAARCAEEVFGVLAGSQDERLEAARRIFRYMAKAVHPDLFQGTADFDRAGSAFKQLSHFWELARIRIECVIAVVPFDFTPRKSALSLIPVAQKTMFSPWARSSAV